MVELGSIGIDIGGTKILFALFDPSFQPIDQIKMKTGDLGSAKDFKEALTESLGTLLKKATKSNLPIAAVGIGCAASLNGGGTIKSAPNIPFLDGFPLR